MKAKLLILTPRFPYPPIGGDRLRIYHLCRLLAPDFELSLLSMCGSREEMEMPAPQDGVFGRIDRVYHGRRQRLMGFLGVLPSRIPLQVGYYRNPEFSRRLAELAPLHDGVLAHLVRTADYIAACPQPRILEMTDAISMSYLRTHDHRLKNPLWATVYREDAQRLQHYERALIGQMDLTILASAVDRDYIVPGAGREKTFVCPNGVDAGTFRYDFSPDGETIAFIGNVAAYHNFDAVLYFIQEALPLVRQRHPRARLKVVGKIKRKLERRLRRYPGVEVTGTVDSVPLAVRGASVGICPVRFGAGIQNKLLEYMALGIPAITSPIGLEGIDAAPGLHLLVACTPQEWADKVCLLLDNPELARGLAVAGRELIEQHYSWESRVAPLRSAIVECLSRSMSFRVA